MKYISRYKDLRFCLVLLGLSYCFGSGVFAQNTDDGFPIPLRPGQSFEIPSNTEHDTLFWLFKNKQIEKMLNDADSQAFNKQEIDILKALRDGWKTRSDSLGKKVNLLQLKISKLQEKNQKIVQKDSLLNEIILTKNEVAALNYQGYVHYRDLWKETDIKLERAEISIIRQRKWMFYSFLIGGLVGTSVAILIK